MKITKHYVTLEGKRIMGPYLKHSTAQAIKELCEIQSPMYEYGVEVDPMKVTLREYHEECDSIMASKLEEV